MNLSDREFRFRKWTLLSESNESREDESMVECFRSSASFLSNEKIIGNL